MFNYLFFLFVTKLNTQAERRHFMPFINGAICGGFVYVAIALYGGNGFNVIPLVAALLVGAFLGAAVTPLGTMPAIDEKDFEIGQVHRVWYFPKRKDVDGDNPVVFGPYHQMFALCNMGIFSLLNDPNQEEAALRLLEQGQLPITSRMRWVELTDLESITYRSGAGKPTQLQCIEGAPHASMSLYFEEDHDREEFLQLCAKLRGETLERHEEPMPAKEALKSPCALAGLGAALGLFLIFLEVYAPASSHSHGGSAPGAAKDLGVGCILISAIAPVYVMIRWPKINCVKFLDRKKE